MTATGTAFVGIDAAADAVRKLLARLAAKHGKLHVCYG